MHVAGDVAEELALDSGHGDISAKVQTARALDVRTGRGDLRVAAANIGGLLTVKTGAGDVEIIAEAVGEFVAHSGTGSVGVVLDSTDGRAEITTSNGDIKLVVSDDLRFNLDASTSNGDADCRLDLANLERHKDGRSVRGSRLGGGPDIRLRSGSGDVVVRTR